VVSFPLLLDRDVGLASAIATSFRVIAKNPLTMMVWGLMVTGLLLLGALPFFIGLAVIVPVLGHATWHLYRKVIASDPNARPVPPPPYRPRKPAADFPANLFPWRNRTGE